MILLSCTPMQENKEASKTHARLTVGLIKIGACLVFLAIFALFVPKSAWLDLRNIHWGIGALLVLITFLLMGAQAFRFFLLLRSLQIKAPYLIILQSVFFSAFAGIFLMFTAAGETARFFWLVRQIPCAKRTYLLSAMLLDRVISGAINIIMLLGLLFFLGASRYPVTARQLVLISFGILGLALLCAGIMWLSRKFWQKISFFKDLLSAGKFFVHAPGIMIICCLISVLLFLGAAFLILAGSLYAVDGSPLSWEKLLFVALASSLLALVPITPAGLGFMEASQAGMLIWFGCPVSIAAQTVVLLRCISIVSALPGCISLFRKAKYSDSEKEHSVTGTLKKVD